MTHIRIRPGSLALFVFLMSSSTNAQSLSFNRTDILTGTAPKRVAVADFNHDGISDMVVLNSSGSSLSVLLSNGDGTFRAPLNTTLGAYPREIAVGDVNLDGFPDVITDDTDNNQLYVLLGKGDGTFRAPITFSGSASGLAIGDFNGDGKPDFAATDFANGKIIIWLGRGDGTFSNQSTVAVGTGLGSGTNAVVAVDLNRDGKLDLVAVNMFLGTVSVTLGNGDGTFHPAVNYPLEVGTNPQALAVTDINADGIPDIVVGEMPLFSVAVFLGNGDGTFRNLGFFPLASTLGPQPALFDVALGDVSGDGKPDLIVTKRSPTNAFFVSILPGIGDGTWGQAQDFSTNAGASTPGASAVALADFNHDGKLDIVTATTQSNGATVLLNTTVSNVGPVILSVSPNRLNVGYVNSVSTSPQTVSVSLTSGAGVGWTASVDQPYITISPTAGVGNGTFQVTVPPVPGGGNGHATITVAALGATGSPQQIPVSISSVAVGLPYGSFDTPLNNSTNIAGAIPVTGWALDNVEVTGVGIYRDPIGNEPTQLNGLVYIGNGTFVGGVRPDVEATYPNAPLNYQAGWGYMLLTNFLPHSGGAAGPGNGTYSLHAIAVNKAGQSFDLGTRTITVDNADAAKPFGTIDTPAQGGVVSGNAFVNFGWALTQNPHCIPTDGSTLTVVVDGVTLGHPVYNQARSDIQNFFPGLCNTNGAVGFFYIDITLLANGLHTISWVAYDNVGHGDGLGSRYFTVANTGGGNSPAVDEPVDSATNSTVMLQRDFDHNSEPAQLAPDETGVYSVYMEELDRIEMEVGATNGYLLMKDERRPLPVGSTLKSGRFYWHAGPGFLGEYDLLFERADATLVRVRVKIRPKVYAGRESR